ncbi:acyl-CoA dehydrogenase [Mycolicibacterium insubricum]|uniref:Uncharacterized protein n=1 Tax=Mycolicibacterium insubricum TaxID=444597 RepID=A0A1X0D3T6_9MYCO|nr:acyl-CoA dehydrogenase family protein [Mycolicibacterium insubricum]MCB9439549.1 acyl-CoA/acyl-ACP dehydrogenase [Mycolicibacterium sp.]ORA67064.1 hypothetical protein BST26_16335 [Mycolicibacterium insubricum]BBZ65268.1 acyl-CoA dehydrogenase [Mycolicibacterium insubricum]
MTDFAELHDELRAVAADVLAARVGEPVDSAVLAELGWTGLEVADELDGAGASFREVAVVAEQLGRNVNGGGYFGSAVLGVGLLNQLTGGAVRDGLLTGIAAGTTTVTVAISSEAGAQPGFVVAETADGPRITGRAPLVLDAGSADTLLVPVQLPDGRSAVAAVGRDAVGLAVRARPVVDETRSLADVSADSVLLAADALLGYTDGVDEPDALTARARAAVACDSLGLSAAMLDATVDYVAVRQQFGRPIGSFQAVKHACADMAVQIAVSRQLVATAVAAVADGSTDAPRAAAMAKAYSTETGVAVAGKAMQLHGGIGYTWEAGIHRYLKRATLNRALFGSPARLRRELSRYRTG